MTLIRDEGAIDIAIESSLIRDEGDVDIAIEGLLFSKPGESDVPSSSGQFTIEFDGFAATYEQTFDWAKAGKIVVLHIRDHASQTSNATNFTTGANTIPEELWPAQTTDFHYVRAQDNSSACFAVFRVSTTGVLSAFKVTTYGGAPENWTATGSKQMTGGLMRTMAYIAAAE